MLTQRPRSCKSTQPPGIFRSIKSFTRYKPSPLISVALEVLGSITERNNPDVRDLERLDLDSPNGKKFARFFKKVRIKVRLPSGWKWKQEGKPISGVVTQAGHYEFRNKDDRPVTVQVCFPIIIRFLLLHCMFDGFCGIAILSGNIQCKSTISKLIWSQDRQRRRLPRGVLRYCSWTVLQEDARGSAADGVGKTLNEETRCKNSVN